MAEELPGLGDNSRDTGNGLNLEHGWSLAASPDFPMELVQEFVRPAVSAVPRAMANRLKPCRIALPPRLAPADAGSQWSETGETIEIAIAHEGIDPHDAAMELLLCIGQALWETLSAAERSEFLLQLQAEIEAGVEGEIEDEVLREKSRLFSARAAARSTRRLLAYARASFAATAAEYVHCLWHDVTVRTGPEHLPPRWLRSRLELMERWFPPNPDYRLFPPGAAG